jgi:methylglutaconyl-CoA hydratase
VSGEALRRRLEGPRLTLALCRPQVHNALNAELIDALGAALRDAAADGGVRYIVLQGEGPSFCAGADLDWMRAALGATREQNEADAARFVETLEAIVRCPKPVIARVHGPALAGGMGLVAACDLAVAGPGALFGLTEVRLGLVPAMIFPYLLRKVAPRDLRWAALTGERFGPQRARDLGLVNEVSEDVDQVIARWADQLVAAAPQAQARVKEMMRTLPGLTPEAARAYTVALIAEVRAGAEGQEGMRAFLEKRRPAWRP